LGGIGKTQIATEYAYQHHQDYQAVLWTLADTREALVSGYVAIARLLNLREKEEKDQSITVNAVIRWLKTHTKWLLILDSADELDIVREFVPPVFSGHILITTRAQAMGKLARRIEVVSMSQDVGALLLLRRATLLARDAELSDADASDVPTAKEISEELGGLPLALDQAGAYIEETSCSLLEYLRLYRMRRDEMLKRRGGSASDYPQSVATTWSLSFEKVEQRCLAAGDLLRFCAYLAPDVIPESIVTQGASYLGSLLAPVAADPFLLGQAVEALRAYSLVQRDPRMQTLSVHRLVQAVLRDSIETRVEKEWKERVVRAVEVSCPNLDDMAQWNVCERWLPHARVCAYWIEQENMINPQATELLNKAGCYLKARARYADAEPLLVRAYSIRKKQLGASHPSMASGLNNLAALYDDQGKYAKAEPLYLEALRINEHLLGSEHLWTLASRNNLAELYRAQGKDTEAEQLHRQVLEIREKYLGAKHPHTASSLNNLAALYHTQGKYTQAGQLYRQALEICEQVLGSDHPDTRIVRESYAALLLTQKSR
jgi:tetratricopeptide (TPR) repeat protein